MRKINKIFIPLILVFLILFCTSCAKKYKITFNYNYDDIVEEVYFKSGAKIEYPTVEREGYDFDGWYENKKLTKPYTEELAKEDKKLYASWKEKMLKYKITYDLNGGKCEDLVNSFDDYKDVSLPTPSKTNYEFAGWYESGKPVTSLSNRNYSLEARWNAIYFDVDDPIIDRVRDKYTVYKDIVYKNASGHTLKLDLYLPALEENETCPALFIYYGGGFVAGSKEINYYIQDVVDYAIENEIALIMPNYRLAYEALYPYPVQDVVDSIRFCVKYNDMIGLDLDNIGLIGYSAGAYMSLMAAFAADEYSGIYDKDEYPYSVKYVVDLFGPAYYSIEEIRKIGFRGMLFLTQFYGTANLYDPSLQNSMPNYYIEQIENGTCDTLVYIVHGIPDTVVPPVDVIV